MFGTNKRRIIDAFAVTASIAAVIFLIVWSGSETLCFFRTLTGLPCPGCGLTSATLALLHGDIVASLKYHPGLFLAGIAALVFLLSRYPFFRRFSRSNCFFLTLFAAFMAIYIVKMCLYFPSGPYPMNSNYRHSVIYKLQKIVFPK